MSTLHTARELARENARLKEELASEKKRADRLQFKLDNDEHRGEQPQEGKDV